MKIKNSSLLEIFSGKYKVLDDKDEVLFYLNEKMNITKVNKKNIENYFVKINNVSLLSSGFSDEENKYFTIHHKDNNNGNVFVVKFSVSKDGDGGLSLLPMGLYYLELLGNRELNLHLDKSIKNLEILKTKNMEIKLNLIRKNNDVIEILLEKVIGGQLLTETKNGNIIKKTEVNYNNDTKIVTTTMDSKNDKYIWKSIYKKYEGGLIKDEFHTETKNGDTEYKEEYTDYISGENTIIEIKRNEKIKKVINKDGFIILKESIKTSDDGKIEIKERQKDNNKVISTINNGRLKVETFIDDRLVMEKTREKDSDGFVLEIINYIDKERRTVIKNSDNEKIKEIFIKGQLAERYQRKINGNETVKIEENFISGKKNILITKIIKDINNEEIGKDVTREFYLYDRLRSKLIENFGKNNKRFKMVLTKHDEFGNIILNSEKENKELLNKFLKEKVKNEDKKNYIKKNKLKL